MRQGQAGAGEGAAQRRIGRVASLKRQLGVSRDEVLQRTTVGPGSCFGEVAFFTEIPQHEVAPPSFLPACLLRSLADGTPGTVVLVGHHRGVTGGGDCLQAHSRLRSSEVLAVTEALKVVTVRYCRFVSGVLY